MAIATFQRKTTSTDAQLRVLEAALVAQVREPKGYRRKLTALQGRWLEALQRIKDAREAVQRLHDYLDTEVGMEVLEHFLYRSARHFQSEERAARDALELGEATLADTRCIAWSLDMVTGTLNSNGPAHLR